MYSSYAYACVCMCVKAISSEEMLLPENLVIKQDFITPCGRAKIELIYYKFFSFPLSSFYLKYIKYIKLK